MRQLHCHKPILLSSTEFRYPFPIIFIVISSDITQYDGDDTQDTKTHPIFTFFFSFSSRFRFGATQYLAHIHPKSSTNAVLSPHHCVRCARCWVLLSFLVVQCYSKKLSLLVHIYTLYTADGRYYCVKIRNRQQKFILTSFVFRISVLVFLLACHSFCKRFFFFFSFSASSAN